MDWIKESQNINLITNRELDRVRQLRLVYSPCSSISSSSSNSQKKGISIKKTKIQLNNNENITEQRKVKIKEKSINLKEEKNQNNKYYNKHDIETRKTVEG
jgi:hypothetical protein